MSEVRWTVPTYNANRYPELVENGMLEEWGDPSVPVLLRYEEGVRVLLGTHDYSDCNKPDLAIERRPGGWAIVLHPKSGDDPVGWMYFLDDGRSYLQLEQLVCGHHMVILDCGDEVPGMESS